VGSTNRAGTIATALELVRELVETTGRRLQEQLGPLFDRLQALAKGWSPARALPAPPGVSAPAAGGQEIVERAKFGTGEPPAPSDGELPRAYGQSRAVLMARDPWSLFAYWEVPPVRRVEVLRALGVEGEGTREVLRVYEVAADSSASWDLDLAPGAERADIRADRPGRSYRIEVGLRTAAGRFVSLVTSNLVSAPPAEPSRDTTASWVTVRRDGHVTESPGEWSGRRIQPVAGATELGRPGERSTAGASASRSSDSVPAGPRASDALPLR
jgi:hypothetical protein